MATEASAADEHGVSGGLLHSVRRAAYRVAFAWLALLVLGYLGDRLAQQPIMTSPMARALSFYGAVAERYVVSVSAQVPVEVETPAAFKALGMRVLNAWGASGPRVETHWDDQLHVVYLWAARAGRSGLVSVQTADAAGGAVQVTLRVRDDAPVGDPALAAAPARLAVRGGLGFGVRELKTSVEAHAWRAAPPPETKGSGSLTDLATQLDLHNWQVTREGPNFLLTGYTPYLGRHAGGLEAPVNLQVAMIPRGGGTELIIGTPRLDVATRAHNFWDKS